MTEFVLDASAILALLQNEPGAKEVSATLGSAMVSAVNISEVVAKLSEYGVSGAIAREALASLDMQIIDFDQTQAFDAGDLRSVTRHLGLSLGDRSCLALGRLRKATVVTCDGAWKKLDLGVGVQVVR